MNGAKEQIKALMRLCDSCGDLCGDSVDCRVWVYNGEEYTIPPKALIVEGILRSVYGGEKTTCEETEYKLSENLKKFYAAMNEKNKSCCSGSAGNKCC